MDYKYAANDGFGYNEHPIVTNRIIALTPMSKGSLTTSSFFRFFLLESDRLMV